MFIAELSEVAEGLFNTFAMLKFDINLLLQLNSAQYINLVRRRLGLMVASCQ